MENQTRRRKRFSATVSAATTTDAAAAAVAATVLSMERRKKKKIYFVEWLFVACNVRASRENAHAMDVRFAFDRKNGRIFYALFGLILHLHSDIHAHHARFFSFYFLFVKLFIQFDLGPSSSVETSWEMQHTCIRQRRGDRKNKTNCNWSARNPRQMNMNTIYIPNELHRKIIIKNWPD